MSEQTKHVWIGFSLAVLGTLLFSLKSIFIKFLYQQGLNADSVLVLRMALALPIYSIILMCLFYQNDGKIADRFIPWKTLFLLGFLGYYLASLLDLMGLELISAQLERLSLFTYPFFVTFLGFLFFNHSVSKRLIFSLLLTYSGLWIVMGQELQLTGNNVIMGVSLVLSSALSYAVYVLFSQSIIKNIGSLLFTCIAMIASSFFGLIHGVAMLDWTILFFNNDVWLWLVLLVILSTVIPSFMMAEAIHRIGAAQMGIVGMLGPFFTIGLAVYLLNEPFTFIILIGMMMTVFGVSILVIKKE